MEDTIKVVHFDEQSRPVKLVRIVNTHSADFFILDDETPCEALSIIEYIRQRGMSVWFGTIAQMAANTKPFLEEWAGGLSADVFVAVGQGGKRALRALSRNFHGLLFACTKRRHVQWQRLWKANVGIGFSHNLDKYRWSSLRIVLVEDVVASGETVAEITREIVNRGGIVVGIITIAILGSSPLLLRPIMPMLCSFVALSQRSSDSNMHLDPHWHPPFFSMRHLLYGDEEIEGFHRFLSNQYFNDDRSFMTAIEKI